MRARITLLVVLGWLCLRLSVAHATADDVVLVHPAGGDAFVQEIFHRLGGELRVHSFSIRQEESGPISPTLSVAQALLARTHARACVFLGWQGETSVVQVWIAGTAPQAALFEAVALQRTADVPTMLAARAVDLLAAGLDTRKPPRPVDDVSTATPNPAVTTVKTPENPVADQPVTTKWSLGVAAMMLGETTKFGAAWAPQIVLGKLVSRRIEFLARAAGPFVGARYTTAEASATLTQGFALGEVQTAVASGKHFSLRAGGGGGVYFVRATGTISDGISSIVPGRDDQWTLAGTVGADGALQVSSRVSAVLSAQTLFLVPRPRIVVGRTPVALQEPLVSLAVGVRFAL